MMDLVVSMSDNRENIRAQVYNEGGGSVRMFCVDVFVRESDAPSLDCWQITQNLALSQNHGSTSKIDRAFLLHY